MDEFAKIFDYFEKESLTLLEKKLVSKLYPIIKQEIENFINTRRGYRSWPRYDTGYTDTETILNYKQKIDRIVELLDSSDQERGKFLRNFPAWKLQREKNIEKLRKIAKSMLEVRMTSNIVKITAGSVGVFGGAAILGSLLFPPAAPALLPAWLGGATVSALLPSIFLGTVPAITPLAVAGTVAAAGGALGNVGTSFAELNLNREHLNEAKEVIAEDRRLLEELGVSEFVNEVNCAIDDLFGQSTSDKILNDLIDFLKEIPPILDDIEPIRKLLLPRLSLILPGITKFLLVGISLSSVVLSIFFVVFMIRRRGCDILTHRLALGLVSAVDAGVEITRLISAAGLEGSKLGELIPRQLAGKIVVGATTGVGIALDIATIVLSSIDLAKGSMSDEISMISETASKLESQLSSFQLLNDERMTCMKVKKEGCN